MSLCSVHSHRFASSDVRANMLLSQEVCGRGSLLRDGQEPKVHSWIQWVRIGKISRSDTDILAAAAWGAVALMMLTSLAPVRKRMFGLFRICHFLG
jgi:hypothetical protein